MDAKEHRQKVIDLLSSSDLPLLKKEIRERTGVPYKALKKILESNDVAVIKGIDVYRAIESDINEMYREWGVHLVYGTGLKSRDIFYTTAEKRRRALFSKAVQTAELSMNRFKKLLDDNMDKLSGKKPYPTIDKLMAAISETKSETVKDILIEKIGARIKPVMKTYIEVSDRIDFLRNYIDKVNKEE
jgi:hypothetical protein